MSLFEVPGWSVPNDIQNASAPGSRKRKRPGSEGAEQKLQNAEVNLDKLVKKLGSNNQEQPSHKDKKKNKKKSRLANRDLAHNTEDNTISSFGGTRLRSPTKSTKPSSPQSISKGKDTSDDTHSGGRSPTRVVETLTDSKALLENADSLRKPILKERKKKEARKLSAGSGGQDVLQQGQPSNVHLTALQSKMKQSLDGARFRWINETLYKSSSQDAERLMREDPKVFDEYHAGFRHQVTSWPANPVDHFVQTLESYPAHSVIVDLGCGDAALAQNLLPKGHIVLSYDLVSANPYIIAADICDRIPLPGAYDSDAGQVVDVVVCSLSLMSTNWLNCLREARRVLKTGGELKIAEVASRFTNVDKFTSVVSSIGFRLIRKDDDNTHFTLFDFKKTDGSRSLDEKSWQKILSRGDVLQPCEYKRR